MRALILNDEVKENLHQLRDYAEKHPLSFNDLLDIYNRQKEPPGNTKGYFIYVPVGYKVVFSVEQQKEKIRHLSVGVGRENKFPSPEAVNVIMEHLGFRNTLHSGNCKVWIEENIAVNVVELYN